ncbi:MAG: hypothetical protein WBZ48_00300 [Bacteroidota bacterium]
MKTKTDLVLERFNELKERLERVRIIRDKAIIDFGLTFALLQSNFHALRDAGVKIPPEQLPAELQVFTGRNLADSIAELIRQREPMTRKQIMEILVRSGRIEPKNARIVVFNAIHRDKKYNFSEDKKGLVRVHEK